MPQAIGNVGTGTGTFAGDPSWGNSLGIVQDFSVVLGVAMGPYMPFARGVGTLTDDLAGAAQRAAQSVGPGRGPVYGTKVHTAFKAEVEGLSNQSIRAEVSFLNGFEVKYGTPGSVRLDAVQFASDGRTVLSVYDLKTGSAILTPQRIQQIQQHVGAHVPVNVVRP